MFWTKTTPQKFMPKRTIDALKANFSEHEMVELAKLATPVDIAEGTTLTIEGGLGNQALVMIDGIASVRRNGEHVASIKAGELIGEISLLTGEPRTATVVAETASTVYAMSPRDFATLLNRCPRLAKSIASTAVRRITAAA